MQNIKCTPNFEAPFCIKTATYAKKNKNVTKVVIVGNIYTIQLTVSTAATKPRAVSYNHSETID